MYIAQMYRGYDGPMMDGYGSHESWIGAIFVLLVVLIVAGVAVYLIRAFTDSSKAGKQTEARDPLDIARERYAKGEITKEELADIKKELK